MGLKRKLEEMGFEDSIVFSNYDYEDAIIGISNDGRVIYDYDLMIKFLVEKENMGIMDAMEWIDYNTLGALPNEPPYPIIMYKIGGENNE